MFDNHTQSDGPLRAERFLTAKATPPPIGREAEIRAIRDAVRPLTTRQVPENPLVFGPPGSGKTICVKHVFEALDRETSVKPIRINCWQYRTRPALLTELLIRLGYPAPRKGKPVDELLGKLREWLTKNRSVALALDEFDQLQDKTEAAYDLSMLNQQAENKLGIVMISNVSPDELMLDERTRSRLNCRTIEFEPYTAAELEAILDARIEQAFVPGSVPQAVREKVATDAAAAGGDCRAAFERLLQAGRKAAQEGARELTIEHLDAVDRRD